MGRDLAYRAHTGCPWGGAGLAQLSSLSPSPGCSPAALIRDAQCPLFQRGLLPVAPMLEDWWMLALAMGQCQLPEPGSGSSLRSARLLIKPCHQSLL